MRPTVFRERRLGDAPRRDARYQSRRRDHRLVRRLLRSRRRRHRPGEVSPSQGARSRMAVRMPVRPLHPGGSLTLRRREGDRAENDESKVERIVSQVDQEEGPGQESAHSPMTTTID
jgi:hypothetical protein